MFNTLQDLMTHSKGVTYLLMGGVLLGMIWFWRFLCAKDEKQKTF